MHRCSHSCRDHRDCLGIHCFKAQKGNGLKYRTAAVDRDYSKALVVTASALNPVTLVDVGARVPGKIENVYVDFISQVKEG